MTTSVSKAITRTDGARLDALADRLNRIVIYDGHARIELTPSKGRRVGVSREFLRELADGLLDAADHTRKPPRPR